MNRGAPRRAERGIAVAKPGDDAIGSITGQQTSENSATLLRPALDLTTTLRVGERLTLYPGARLAYYGQPFNRTMVEPRLRASSGPSDYIFVAMSPTGDVTYATYNGGTGNDHAGGGLDAADGSVVIGGATTSSSNIATSGAPDTVYSGGFDAFVTFIRVFAI